MAWPGEKESWDILSDLDPKNINTNAKALFNSYNSTYELTCFGQAICISLKDRNVFSKSSLGKLLVYRFIEKGTYYLVSKSSSISNFFH